MSRDSLLHVFFNANDCQWASENNHWELLRKFFSKQQFSTKENIEKIKQFENYFLEIFDENFNSFEIDPIVDLMFSIVKENSLNLLSFQEKFSQH